MQINYNFIIILHIFLANSPSAQKMTGLSFDIKKNRYCMFYTSKGYVSYLFIYFCIGKHMHWYVMELFPSV